MANFVDDNTALPSARSDKPGRVLTNTAWEVAAGFLNSILDGLSGLRARALKKDPVDAAALTPFTPDFSKFKLISSAADSRDAPVNCLIFGNTGLTNNPMFCIGNPYLAGVNLEAMGLWYTDDTLPAWLLHKSWERSGTDAAVLDGIRRSAFEVFLNHGDQKPAMRLDPSRQAFQVGAGGFLVAPGGAVRSGGVLTLTTAVVHDYSTGQDVQQLHKMGVGQKLWKQPAANKGSTGDTSRFGPNGDLWGNGGTEVVVASVVSPTVITVVDARTGTVNVEWLSISTEALGDVELARGPYGVAEIRSRNRTDFYAGPNLDQNALSVGPDTVHVRDGKELFCEGAFRGTGWFNGGGETMTFQRNFVVGGSSTGTATLPTITKSWQECFVKNLRSGNLTINRNSNPSRTGGGFGDGTSLVNGGTSIVIPPGAGAHFLSNDVNNDWVVFYHPPPP